jgi:polyisoprenoid-binding protein YceI
MAVATGSHRLGPESASLQVKTYREGVAAKVGHDLVIDVTRWDAMVEIAADLACSSVELRADSRSMQVRDGVRGVKPLTDKDRDEIRNNIDEKVLHRQPISFRSSAVRLVGDARLVVEGNLTISASTRPITAQLDIDGEGRVSGTIPLAQSSWGIKPYRGLMGALEVRDELEIVIAARLPVR